MFEAIKDFTPQQWLALGIFTAIVAGLLIQLFGRNGKGK